MTEHEKIKLAVQDLKQRGLSSWSASPPLFWLLWKLGIPIPPPFFLGFRGHVIAIGGLIAVPVAIYLRFRPIFPPGDPDLPAGDPLWLTICAALLFGFTLGLANYAYFRWRARRLELPAWSRYPESSAGLPTT